MGGFQLCHDEYSLIPHKAPQYYNVPFSLAVNSLQSLFYTQLATTYAPSVSPEKHATPPPPSKKTTKTKKQNKTKNKKKVRFFNIMTTSSFKHPLGLTFPYNKQSDLK